MNSKGYTEQLYHKILQMPAGTPFVVSDFAEITDRTTIRRLLKVMADRGDITRIMRGLFFRPRISGLLNESVPVNPNAAAEALARANGWIITPDGETALNLLGLSTQVPAKWTYISDGPYRRYEFDGITLTFKHTANKSLNALSPVSRMVVQAIKAMKKENLASAAGILAQNLSLEDKALIFAETTRVTEWIRGIITEVYKGAADNAAC